MPATRHLIGVLATAAILAPAAPARAQSGAGDDQYTDPFGSSGSSQSQTTSRKSSSKQTSSRQQQPPSSSSPGLSQQPPVSGSSGSSGSTGSSGSSGSTSTTPSTTAPATGAQATSQLPRTGFEVPGIALLGAGLLVTGVGLRLRTVDDQLF